MDAKRSLYGGLALGCAAALAAGCQLVSGLGKLETNEGGGGATGATGSGEVSSSTNASGGPTSGATSSASGSGGAGTGGSASSSSATGSGTGGAPAELTPCGGVTDGFNSGISNAVWTVQGNATGINARVRMNVVPGQTSELRLSALETYQECYASIRLLGGGNLSTMFLEVFRVPAPMSRERLTYASMTGLIQETTAGIAVPANPSYLGLAFHGSLVHFLYKSGFGAWTPLGSIPRDAWMDALPDNSIGFGVVGNNGSDTVNFDDFNVDPIHLADL